MFDEWRFEAGLRKIQARKEKTEAIYARLYREAKVKRDTEAVEQIAGEAGMERNLHEMEIEEFVTEYLRNTAVRSLIAIPPYPRGADRNEYWKQNYVENGFVLTEAGIEKLRDAIDVATEKRWKRRYIWLTPISGLVSLLTGLGGIAITLLSLLMRHS